MVLNMVPDGILVCGPDCSSWGLVARASSGRNFVNPNGYMQSDWVSRNNVLVSRTLACSFPHMCARACVHAGNYHEACACSGLSCFSY